MNTYELLYIIDKAVDDAAKDALIAQYETMVVSDGGTVMKIDKWGDKRYSYPINFKDDGYYVLMTYMADSKLPKEMERRMRNNEQIVRWMTLRK